MKPHNLLVAVSTLALAFVSCPAIAADARKPNVVVILADDIGYSDISLQGDSLVPTPNIDSIAQNGVRCTNGYVSCPYCSPTRAGIMTGRYQQRFGHEYNEGKGRLPFGLPLTETTFAQRMKELGYATAVVGKWHLGFEPQFRPMQRGFDEFYGTLANTPFFHPNLVDSRVSPNPRRVEDDTFYTTDAYAARATDFIDKHADAPFFLYLPFNACHGPIEAPGKYFDRLTRIAEPPQRMYAAVLSAMDAAVGQVLTTLREHNLEENTLIFFLSDNGSAGSAGSNNKPLRGQKMATWEGGIRVPFFVQWKAAIPAGTVYDQPVISLDLLPTAVAAAGGEVQPDWHLDGVNLLPYLTKKYDGVPHSVLFWRLGPQWAVRMGNWKLVRPKDPSAKPPGAGASSYAVLPKPWLIDLAADPIEEHDLSAEHPDKVKELQTAWD
ncbi:MAG TPA: sulfatase-like hydrolase/transferase, partial [Pirellulales bacterium]